MKCVIHVFQAVLTDKGICCSFNMKAAEERFLSKKYSTMLKMSQQSELSLAFYNTTLADATGDAKEPYPQASMNRILYYTLFKFSYNFFRPSPLTAFVKYLFSNIRMGLSRHGIQTRGHWVRSANATSLLCSPPAEKRNISGLQTLGITRNFRICVRIPADFLIMFHFFDTLIWRLQCHYNGEIR